MKPVTTKRHFASCILHFALCILLVLLSACAEGPDSSNEASSDTGSISFNVAWEGTTSESTVLQAVDLSDNCEAYGVSWIKAQVLDENDKVIAEAPRDSDGCGWPCTQGEGTITGVPVGDNRKVVVFAMEDSNCKVLRQGESDPIPVRAGQTNPAGIIVLCLHVAGAWDITEQVDWTDCDTYTQYQAYTVTVTQKGCNVTATETKTGRKYRGTINDSQISLTGTYPEDEGTTTTTATLTVSGDTLSGSASWTWTNDVDPNDTCSGTTQISGSRISGAPPTASIDSPSDGSGYDEGDTITFTGSGDDAEDGTLTGSSLVWTSSIDGQIGTGTTFTRDDLSVGTHTITLTATDSDGATGSDLVSITVSPPSVTVRLDMDNLPEDEGWSKVMGSPAGTSWVSNGILTIDSPSYFEYWAPDDWINSVSNQNGWIIETRMRLDPTTVDDTSGSIRIWIHDNTYLTQIGFHKDKVFIDYPDDVDYPMNTTSNFHVYRIEGMEQSFKLFVDGNLAIDYHRTWAGGGTKVLYFGDGVGANYSKSYWDYFFYVIF